MTTATTDRPTAAPASPALARFDQLVPYQSQHAENGIPKKVLEYLAANRVFPVVCPEGLVGRNALAPLRGWPGLCMTIAECVPGHGPVSHNHTGTLETFYCLEGEFDVKWGNALEHKVHVQPGDLVSVPPGQYRTFQNTGDRNASLLVLIQGDRNMSDKIEMPRAIGEQVRQEHGDRVMELLAAINMRFQGEQTPEYSPAQMAERVVRKAQLRPEQAGGETVLPVMRPAAGAAPVHNWPGLDVALLQGAPGQASSTTLDADHCQWIINLGDAEWQVSVDGSSTVLGRYDFICAPEGSTRTVRNLSDGPAELLLATQGRDTIAS